MSPIFLTSAPAQSITGVILYEEDIAAVIGGSEESEDEVVDTEVDDTEVDDTEVDDIILYVY